MKILWKPKPKYFFLVQALTALVFRLSGVLNLLVHAVAWCCCVLQVLIDVDYDRPRQPAAAAE